MVGKGSWMSASLFTTSITDEQAEYVSTLKTEGEAAAI
jgi:hypothetical protein